MQQFCIHCGSKALYESNPPKFCPSCGSPWNKSLSSKRPIHNEEEDDYEDDDLESIGGGLSINKTELAKDYSIEGYANGLGESFSSLVFDQAAPKGTLPKRQPNKSVPDGPEVLKQVLSECAKPKTSREVG